MTVINQRQMKSSFGLTDFLRKLLTNPLGLLWYYVIICMAPSFYFAISQPVNFIARAIILFFPLGFFLLVLSLVRNSGRGFVFLFPVFLLNGFQIILFYLFRGPDAISADMFLNVVTTSTSEAGELLSSMTQAILVICLLYIPALILAIIQWSTNNVLKKNIRKKMILTSLIFLSLSFALFPLSKNSFRSKFTFHNDVYPANIVYNLGFAIHKIIKVKNYPQTSKPFLFDAVKKDTASKRMIVVLIIGETGRAVSWQLYGYNRPTNPNLEKQSNLIVFKDAITENNATHKSVPIILSCNDATDFKDIYYRKSIFAAFNEAGFTTVCFSNQPDNHSLTEDFYRQADIFRIIRVKDPATGDYTNPYDEELTDMMKKIIKENKDNLFNVLHSYGSHFNYGDRYPRQFSIFTPDKISQLSQSERPVLINAYDNSIVYTDYFISQTIRALEETKTDAFLVYTSDHGEDIFDDSRNGFLHSSPIPNYFQLRIPFIIWYSNEYKNDFPENVSAAITNGQKPISTNSVFPTLLNAAGITTPYLNNSLSLVSNNFTVKPRMYLDDHDHGIPYLQMNLAPEDLFLLKKNRIGD